MGELTCTSAAAAPALAPQGLRATGLPWYSSHSPRQRLVGGVRRYLWRHDAEYRGYWARNSETGATSLLDYVFVGDSDEADPAALFPRLRWGGIVVIASRDRQRVATAADLFRDLCGFVVDAGPTPYPLPPWSLCLGRLAPKAWYCAARKVCLVPPGTFTDRFTYHVELTRHHRFGSGYVVMKEVPSHQLICARLRDRFPEADTATIIDRAHKLVDKVFPIFLTREAAFLNILQRDLPKPYADRVPRVLGADKDDRGFVRRLHLNWLRNGGEPISQLDFARQGADLLRVLHDRAGVIHLDLRLDNFVITASGVGFVDFGSAVRVDEKLHESKMLQTLFTEMMCTSESQKRLSRMTRKGKVTSSAISRGLNRVDKAVDLFCLAVEMNEPHLHPDLKDLVRYDAQSNEAKALAKLTRKIMQPSDPARPTYQTAADILAGIERVGEKLTGGVPAGVGAE